jgi:hypothetical protein
LSGALFVIGVFAMYRWVVSPHVAYLHAVQRLEPAVERIAAEDDRIRRSLGTGLYRLQGVRQERAVLQERLFTNAEFTTFIRNLPALVEQTGGTVLVADFTGGSNGGSAPGAGPDAAFAIRHAGLTVRATLDQIAVLLDRLQKNRPKVWVDALRVGQLPVRPAAPRDGLMGPAAGPEAERFSGSGAEPFQCQLALTMYTLADPAPARPPESKGPVP